MKSSVGIALLRTRNRHCVAISCQNTAVSAGNGPRARFGGHGRNGATDAKTAPLGAVWVKAAGRQPNRPPRHQWLAGVAVGRRQFHCYGGGRFCATAGCDQIGRAQNKFFNATSIAGTCLLPCRLGTVLL